MTLIERRSPWFLGAPWWMRTTALGQRAGGLLYGRRNGFCRIYLCPRSLDLGAPCAALPSLPLLGRQFYLRPEFDRYQRQASTPQPRLTYLHGRTVKHRQGIV